MGYLHGGFLKGLKLNWKHWTEKKDYENMCLEDFWVRLSRDILRSLLCFFLQYKSVYHRVVNLSAEQASAWHSYSDLIRTLSGMISSFLFSTGSYYNIILLKWIFWWNTFFIWYIIWIFDKVEQVYWRERMRQVLVQEKHKHRIAERQNNK